MNSLRSVEVRGLASSLIYIQDYQLVSCDFCFELNSILPLPKKGRMFLFPIISFMGGRKAKQCNGDQPSVEF